MKTASRFALLCGMIASAASANAQYSSHLSAHSRDEEYFYYTDLLSSIYLNPLWDGTVLAIIKLAVSAGESIMNGCGTVSLMGIDLQGEGALLHAERAIPYVAGAAGSYAVHFNWNDIEQYITPSFQPCGGPVSVLDSAGGSLSAYTAHFGTGPYHKKIRSGDFSYSQVLEIENHSGQAIEVPVHIAGSLVTAIAWGWDPDRTYAKGNLSLTGSVGGQSVSRSIHAEAHDIFGDSPSIDETLHIQVPSAEGAQMFQINVAGHADVEVQAKSAGFGGTLTDSATAGCDFPHTIAVGMPTGLNGGALPQGVLIRDAENHAIYQDSRPWQSFVPTGYSVISGTFFTGSVAALQSKDNSKLSLFDADDLTAELEVVGTSPLAQPQELFAACDSNVSRPGLAAQLLLFNNSTHEFDLLDGVEAPVESMYFGGFAESPVNRYLDSQSKVRARLYWEPYNDETPTQDGWLHYVDHVTWRVL